MNKKLIIVEGLPGSGKTTVSRMINQYLSKKGVDTEFYAEGNLDHPADYDRVAFFSNEEYISLLAENEEYKETIAEIARNNSKGYFIFYGKERLKDKLSVQLYGLIIKHDIYEVPLELHIELILDSWQGFVQQAQAENKTYIFECCFLQNPVTTGMIRDNAPKPLIVDYVKRLNNIINPLNPLLIYLTQNDIEKSFKRVIPERPTAWFDFFISYYTTQGYGKANNYQGLTGTIEVLKARYELELEILAELEIDKRIIDNSAYDKQVIDTILSELIG